MRHPTSEHPESRRGGFTLVEFAVVVTVIAVIVAIAVPNLISARMETNETSAITLLRRVAELQEQFAESAVADGNQDGEGEFGVFAELLGQIGVRGKVQRYPADRKWVLRVNVAGEVSHGGYLFRIYLPGEGGMARRERPYGGLGDQELDPELAETHWSCYAWPATFGTSGHRTFFLGQDGTMIATNDASYSGTNAPGIRAGAALVTTRLDRMTAEVAVGTLGGDANLWRKVE